MREDLKVYIKGMPGRGKEVIKILTDLGGKESNSYLTGANKRGIYYIQHNLMISFAAMNTEMSKIIMDNYKEIKLPEQWKNGDILYSDTDKEFAVFKDKWKLDSDKFLAYFATCHGGYLTLQAIRRRGFRLTTKLEVEQFYEYLHSIGKDWDSENKQLVKWKWKPKDGEGYYYIFSNGIVHLSTWFNDKVDNSRFSIGNYFKTKEEAEVMAEKFIKLLKGKS